MYFDPMMIQRGLAIGRAVGGGEPKVVALPNPGPVEGEFVGPFGDHFSDRGRCDMIEFYKFREGGSVKFAMLILTNMEEGAIL